MFSSNPQQVVKFIRATDENLNSNDENEKAKESTFKRGCVLLIVFVRDADEGQKKDCSLQSTLH